MSFFEQALFPTGRKLSESISKAIEANEQWSSGVASQAADGDGTTENSKHEAERKRDPLVALLSHHKDEHNKSEKVRPKFMPEVKSTFQLTNLNFDVPQGPRFGDHFGDQNDGLINVCGGNGQKQLISNFDDCLSKEILRNLQAKNYEKPTQIQKAVIPIIKETKFDLLAHSQTGTGKTAAFLLPVIDEIHNFKRRPDGLFPINSDSPFAIILGPTRELVHQLYEEARSFAIGTSVEVAFAFGDTPMHLSLQVLRRGCDILVATIGRLGHYIYDGIIKLDSVRYFIIDEADKLLDTSDSLHLVSEIQKRLRKAREATGNELHRTLFFSATYSAEVRDIAPKVLRPQFFFVSVGGLNRTGSSVSQTIVNVTKYRKMEKLLEILRNSEIKKVIKPNGDVCHITEKTIVFINGRREADRLAFGLIYYDYSTISLHSKRTQRQRHEAAQKFIDGTYTILVATDCAARGLNFGEVAHVINYDMPRKEQFVQYIHRIGRTGRVGNIGRSTTFFDHHNVEEDQTHVINLVKTLKVAGQHIPQFLNDLHSNQESLIAKAMAKSVETQQQLQWPSSSSAIIKNWSTETGANSSGQSLTITGWEKDKATCQSRPVYSGLNTSIWETNNNYWSPERNDDDIDDLE